MSDSLHYELEINLPGTIDISERHPCDGRESYRTETLIEVEIEDELKLELCLNTDPEYAEYIDPNSVQLQLSAYHQENPETKRGFHVRVTARLDLDQLKRLRNFADLLLSTRPT